MPTSENKKKNKKKSSKKILQKGCWGPPQPIQPSNTKNDPLLNFLSLKNK
jgi:hypothetical protein